MSWLPFLQMRIIDFWERNSTLFASTETPKLSNSSDLIDLFTEPVWSWKNMKPSFLLLLLLWFDWQNVTLQGGRVAITWSCEDIGCNLQTWNCQKLKPKELFWKANKTILNFHQWREGRRVGRTQKRRRDLGPRQKFHICSFDICHETKIRAIKYWTWDQGRTFTINLTRHRNNCVDKTTSWVQQVFLQISNRTNLWFRFDNTDLNRTAGWWRWWWWWWLWCCYWWWWWWWGWYWRWWWRPETQCGRGGRGGWPPRGGFTEFDPARPTLVMMMVMMAMTMVNMVMTMVAPHGGFTDFALPLQMLICMISCDLWWFICF